MSETAANHIAKVYPWESAGCFWSKMTNINEKASHPYVDSDSISEKINPGEKDSVNSSYGKRAKIYEEKVCKYIKEE